MLLDGFESVSVSEITPGNCVVDIREDYEWREGHISYAVHIPLNDLPFRLEELDPDEDLYVMCRTGGRSVKAVSWLNNQGYSAVMVRGGMGSWQDEGMPMVSDDGEAPRVR